MTTRREFFKITLGAAALTAIPSVVLQPVASIPPLPKFDWLKREVWERPDLAGMPWQIYGYARFGETTWEYTELHDEPPNMEALARFNEMAKDCILRMVRKERLAA